MIRSTYSRVMSGNHETAFPVGDRVIYGILLTLVIASGVFGRSEAVTLLSQPAGIGAALAVVAGLLDKRSMALTPWILVCVALVVYGFQAESTEPSPAWSIAQIILLVLAAGVGLTQLKVQITTGAAASHPSRIRWGSVFVASTACLVVLALSRPDILILDWVRNEDRSGAEDGMARASFGPVERTGIIKDPAIVESSGIASSRTHRSVLWTHNDSGNDPHIYCLRSTGSSCGTWAVNGATNVDWEAMAIGHIGETPHLFLGDIGDNTHTRDGVVVYAVPEPASIGGGRPIAQTEPAFTFHLRYPDGPHDAEAMMVHPDTGDLYLITKELESSVYRAEAPLNDGSPIRLEKIARFSIFGNFADITGGDIAPDGRHVSIATYGGWYELTLAEGTSFDSIWKEKPRLIASRVGSQWEAITYGQDPDSLFITSEGETSRLFRSDRGEN